MTDEKDEALQVIAIEDAVKLIDLGDAVEETKQQFPQGIYPDCIYVHGTKIWC